MSEDNNNQDSSFNEEELQDIMNEIENLEKDFAEEHSPGEESLVEDVTPTNDLQDTIDAEIAELNAITDIAESEQEEVVEGTVVEEPMAEETNVVNLVQPEPTTSAPSVTNAGTFTGAPVEFNCNGEMNVNMNFTVGGQTATLVVDKDQGLTVQLEGVSINISEGHGCSLELPGGIKFTVPLTAEGASATKKAS